MCGIVGYAGNDPAAKIVYDGLNKLEYRGYDSAGIAVMNYGRIEVIKSVGRVQKLNTYAQILEGNIAIGHTRWATHGKPCKANAHPHSAGGITLVHNGIIENYADIKANLQANGEVFLSDTDSEVIVRLINRFYEGDLLEAVIKCADMLKGSYALLVICEGKQEIVAAKYRSPVIIGFGEDGNYCASDEPALAGKCERVCVLEDGDFARITAREVKIYDKSGNRVSREIQHNSAEPAALILSGYPHFMLKELWEAPSTVKNTISAVCLRAEEIKSALLGADKIILTGCGTAYHAALVGKRYFEEFAGISAEVEYAGELRYNSPIISERTALIAVTQSGETADTVEVARLFKSSGAKVFAVTNSLHSAITRIADVVVPVVAGSEICVAATKSYSGQLAALYLIALQLADSGVVEKYSAELNAAPELINKTLQEIDIYALAEMCARADGVYFLGRGIDYAVALEASLKLKEISYLAGGGYPASELKHGTLALIDGGTLSAFIINDPAIAAKGANAVEQTLSRGGMVAVLSCLPEVQAQFAGRAEVIKLPPCGKYLSPFASAAALQYLAYRTAITLNRDPDKPRNLAKSVTVE